VVDDVNERAKARRRDLAALNRYLGTLPHEPMWNLIPRRRPQPIPWECDWHGTVRYASCPACHREHAEYLAAGTWDDRRGYQGWSVSAGGWRLVIEDGVIIGLASGEYPWPWGDPRWLTSHLIADHEIRDMTGLGLPHQCEDECACPRCQVLMIYWPRGDEHACPDAGCPYGAGIRALIGAQLHTIRAAVRP